MTADSIALSRPLNRSQPLTGIKEASNTKAQPWLGRAVSWIGRACSVCTAAIAVDAGLTLGASRVGKMLPETCLDFTKRIPFDIPALMSQALLMPCFKLLSLGTGINLAAQACTRDGMLSNILIAPAVEELFFRSLVQEKWMKEGVEWAIDALPYQIPESGKKWTTRIVPILATSALFAAAHHTTGATKITQAWLRRFATSCLYGTLRSYTGSVVPSIVAHSGHNSLVTALTCLT